MTKNRSKLSGKRPSLGLPSNTREFIRTLREQTGLALAPGARLIETMTLGTSKLSCFSVVAGKTRNERRHDYAG